MTFRVVLQRLAVQNLDEASQWVSRNAPLTAAHWVDRFQAALATLAENPERCPLARENAKVDLELREYLYGRRPHVYRSIFFIDVKTVRILRIRRARRRTLTQRQFGEARQSDE